MANKAQLITLPGELKVYNDKLNSIQFLVTFVSPESELKFLNKIKDMEWNGSGMDL